MRRRKNKKQIRIIVCISICLLLIMTAGYAAFSTNLTLTAKANIDPRTTIYVSSSGNDEQGNGTKNKPYTTIQKAYEAAASKATIYVINSLSVDKIIMFDQDKNITLSGYEGVQTISRGKLNDAILVATKGKILFENITFDGLNKEANNSLIRLENCTATLGENTIIQNNIDTGDHGGGLIVRDSNIFINGAQIINNKISLDGNNGGGGILSRNSNITINSGIISNNYARNGGGVWFGDIGSVLTINNGTISENISELNGGGIVLSHAKSIIKNGEIINNKSNDIAGGIYIYYGELTMKGGSIKNNTANKKGGGIYKHSIGTYTYENGIIDSNIPDNLFQE
ncbi:MAG: hypothetical protein V8R01_04175 [Bacilli bacterium]